MGKLRRWPRWPRRGLSAATSRRRKECEEKDQWKSDRAHSSSSEVFSPNAALIGIVVVLGAGSKKLRISPPLCADTCFMRSVEGVEIPNPCKQIEKLPPIFNALDN